MSFSEDKAFSLKNELLADRLYKSLFAVESIERFTKGDGIESHPLDRYFHIDCVLHLTNGMQITLQEKFLRERYSQYDCFTLEYMNNRTDTGEWHHLATDLYLTTYGDGESFSKIRLFKVFPIKMAIANGELVGTLKQVKWGNASFYAFPFDAFDEDWFVYRATEWKLQ